MRSFVRPTSTTDRERANERILARTYLVVEDGHSELAREDHELVHDRVADEQPQRGHHARQQRDVEPDRGEREVDRRLLDELESRPAVMFHTSGGYI